MPTTRKVQISNPEVFRESSKEAVAKPFSVFEETTFEFALTQEASLLTFPFSKVAKVTIKVTFIREVETFELS